MMFQAQVILDEEALTTLQSMTRRLPEKTRRFAKELTADLEQNILAILSQEPGPPHYPLRWASARQRRYVMAKLRRENNLPYRRTHRLAASWKVESVLGEGNGLIEASNDALAAPYVYGPYQQPFHYDTGWRDAAHVLADLSDYAQEQVLAFWGEATRGR